MKTNSIGKSFTIEKILKIDFQNFHISWNVSKSISRTFLGSLHNETSSNTHFMKCSERNISQCILAYKIRISQYWYSYKISSVLRSQDVWKIVSTSPFLKKNNWKLKEATGSCSVKKVFWGMLLLWNLRCSGHTDKISCS